MSRSSGSPHPTRSDTTAGAQPHANGGRGSALALAALGVVFGDIGTSPLYAMQTVFSIDHNRVEATRGDVFGVISMVFWSITIIVSMKYVALAMRADNEGEGGILALVALLRERLHGRRRVAAAVMLGIVGAALFYGDAVITPAISVMSAIEGVVVVNPSLDGLVLPVSVAILSVLFGIQRWGTHVIGRAFGPVMTLWFVTLAVLGVPHIVHNPQILLALSPTYALAFVLEHPFIAFVAMGGVVLAITGAEALYADMGHFGARAIRQSWYLLVFPALTINYLGQGALILDDPASVANPFFRLAPIMGDAPPGRPRHPGYGHRVPGGHLRGLLGVPPSGASRHPAADAGQAHLPAGSRPDLRARHQLDPLRRGHCPHRRVRQLQPAGHRLRTGRHRHPAADQRAVPRPRKPGLAGGTLEDRRRTSCSSSPSR